jgi:DNA-binding transcriptional ArsR family regulator
MSRHLRVLRTTGLVEEAHGGEAEADARVRVYRLRPERFDSLRAWVADVESFWTLELAAFKRHAERAGRRKRKKG